VLTKHTDVALYAQKSETEMGKKEVFFVGTENEVKVGKFDSVEFPGETKTEVTKEEKAANRKVTTMDLDLTSLKTALKAPKMDFN